MQFNIEIKARNMIGFEKAVEIAKNLLGNDESDETRFTLNQCDTFYKCSTGRLKLREEGQKFAKLIEYSRPDDEGPKLSKYSIAKIEGQENVQDLKRVFEKSLGTIVIVEKKRNVFVIKEQGLSVRVHLDSVLHLGDFIEFEVIVNSEEDSSAGSKVARILMEKFHIEESDLISNAYADLLQSR